MANRVKILAMEEFTAETVIERNPVVHRHHRHEVFWQITVPVLIGVVIVLTLIILATRASSGQASVLADISLIWLITPVLVFSIIFLTLLAASLYGVVKLIEVLPLYARQAHNFIIMLAIKVNKIGNAAVSPIIRIRAFVAQLQYLTGRLHRK